MIGRTIGPHVSIGANNTVRNNNGPGVFLGNGSCLFLGGGSIYDNNGDGVSLSNGSSGQVESAAKIGGNDGCGIDCEGQHSSIGGMPTCGAVPHASGSGGLNMLGNAHNCSP